MLYSHAMSELAHALSEQDLPTDPDALRALLLLECAARIAAEARSSTIEAKLAHMKLEIARLRRETYGQSSECHAHLIEQLERELADLEGDVAQDEIAAEVAAAAAEGKTRTGRLWTYVCDDRPFGGPEPPAAIYFYSPDRGGAHPRRHLADWTGLMQADAFSGYTALYTEGRAPGAILEAACWAHGRRKFFELASLSKAPIALATVEKIDEIFAIQREINGHTAEDRLAVRCERVAPLVANLHSWMGAERSRVSGKSKTGQALDYMLKRWEGFARFLQDGRLCLSNNAAERAIRSIAVGRRNWTFASSDRGGERAAAIYTLMETAKLDDVDPHAWLADVIDRIAETPVGRLSKLLPWNWAPQKLAFAT